MAPNLTFWLCSLVATSIVNAARATVTPIVQGTQLHGRDAAPASVHRTIELDIPVLTVDGEHDLELIDGSSNSIDIIESNHSLCQQTLGVYSFANSYGAPFLGDYTPPSCSFNSVTWNLTITSNGTQYDRLGIIYLGDVEVLRTSTAEPVGKSIIWTYLKSQKIIFDLGNSITATENAPYDVILTATYFYSEETTTTSQPADLILPISKQLSSQNQPSVFSLPTETAKTNITLPPNIRKAIFSIAATGQDIEEFWWSNVLSSDVDALPAYGTLYGFSPFREVQLRIDDTLAGVTWPFPVLFTGALISGLWSPVVGIDVFDLQEDEIDITPWLPLLCDGESHTFELRVVGLNGNGTSGVSETVGNSWLVSGKIFVWRDVEGSVTSGTVPVVTAPALDVSVSSSSSTGPSNTSSAAQMLYYQVLAQRSLAVESTITTSLGSHPSFWRQNLSFSNLGNYTEAGRIETTRQVTTAEHLSSGGYARRSRYPLYVSTGYTVTSRGNTISAAVNRDKDITTVGYPVFGSDVLAVAVLEQRNTNDTRGAYVTNTQNVTGALITDARARTSTTVATMAQNLSLSGLLQTLNGTDEENGDGDGDGFPQYAIAPPILNRQVRAVNGTIANDVNTPKSLSANMVIAGDGSRTVVTPRVRLPGRGYRGKHILSELGLDVFNISRV